MLSFLSASISIVLHLSTKSLAMHEERRTLTGWCKYLICHYRPNIIDSLQTKHHSDARSMGCRLFLLCKIPITSTCLLGRPLPGSICPHGRHFRAAQTRATEGRGGPLKVPALQPAQGSSVEYNYPVDSQSQIILISGFAMPYTTHHVGLFATSQQQIVFKSNFE